MASIFNFFKENLEVVDCAFGDDSRVALLVLNRDHPKLSRVSIFEVSDTGVNNAIPTHSITVKEMFSRNQFTYPKEMKPVKLSFTGSHSLKLLFDTGLVFGVDFGTSELISFMLRPF